MFGQKHLVSTHLVGKAETFLAAAPPGMEMALAEDSAEEEVRTLDCVRIYLPGWVRTAVRSYRQDVVRIQIAHLAGMIWTVSRESRLSPRRAGPVCVGRGTLLCLVLLIVYIAQSDCAAWTFSGVIPRDDCVWSSFGYIWPNTLRQI
jgi:hypothetical protein